MDIKNTNQTLGNFQWLHLNKYACKKQASPSKQEILLEIKSNIFLWELVIIKQC